MRTLPLRSALPGAALALALGAALFAGCDSADDSPAGTFYGTPTAIGDGTARTFVRLDAAGAPEALGVALSADALSGLPADPAGAHTMLNLAFPAQAADLPYAFLSLGWNPNGHEPQGLFTLPHFDFHFYTRTEDEVMAWMPGMPGFENGARMPEERYRPQGYMPDPSGAVVPMMGLHWLDASDATYAPGGPGFTEVFLYGSYDGEMVFAEPMITKAFLEGLADGSGSPVHEEALAQPAAFAVDGLYPTRYVVRWDAEAEAYIVSLEGFTRRTAS
jgi:hypothetical protein